MLRITSMHATNGSMTFKVEGRLGGEWVEELLRIVRNAEAGTARVTLDVSDVTFVDQDGAALLRSLGKRGVGLVGSSTFIQAMVDRCAD